MQALTIPASCFLLQEHNDNLKTITGLRRLIRNYNPALSVIRAIELDRQAYLSEVE